MPIEAVAISGNHGLEVWRDGDVHLAPQAAKYLTAIHEALQMVRNDGLLPELGCHVEDKGITFTIHYRNSPRADHARRYLETQIAPQLERAGLAYNFGRMVLEVRPPVAVDKGAAVKRLRGRHRIDELLFVGDDRSDLDAFREATIRVAVNSAEAPPPADRGRRRRRVGPRRGRRAPELPGRRRLTPAPPGPLPGGRCSRTLEGMRTDAIMVEVSPQELVEISPGVVDVFDALGASSSGQTSSW